VGPNRRNLARFPNRSSGARPAPRRKAAYAACSDDPEHQEIEFEVEVKLADDLE